MTHPDDQLLDARLRDVPMPPGLPGRVAPEALFGDAAIDRLLLLVDLPDGLADRTRRAMAAIREGANLPLSTIPNAPGRGGAVGHGGGRQGAASRRMRLWPAAMDLLADGAAVAAALSIVALMFFAGTELSRRLAAPAAVPQRVAGRGAAATQDSAAAELAARRDARAGTQETDQATERTRAGDTSVVDGGRPRADGPPQLSPVAAGTPVLAAEDSSLAVRPPEPAGAGVEVRAAPAVAEQTGVGDRGSRAGGIRTVILPATGRHVPRVPAYDIAFEMAHGEAPFVDPSRAAVLAVDHPPLSLRTDSFDSLCEAASREQERPMGRRPRRGGMPSVRVEDILAALPAAAGAAGGAGPDLSVGAVRSLRPSPGSLLVEVCAAAPPLSVGDAAAGSRPLDAMLVLDQSAGPFASLSWQWLCRGLRRVVGQMRPADRLSLVVCGERPRLVALRADAASLLSLLPELMREPTAKHADFDAAFRLVAAVGRREGRPDRIVAAAHADSLDRCRAEGRAALSEWQAARAAASDLSVAPITEFVLVDPQQPIDAEGGTAVATPGCIAADPIAIARAMQMQVFGRPTLVASGCRLEVTFDPTRVGSYRIVGHRQTASDALAVAEPRPIELHAGEVARVVYEVILRPGPARTPAATADLVSATLTWTPAKAGSDGMLSPQRVRRGLSNGSAASADDPRAVLPSPHGCELLLAVALGQLGAASVHAEPWRQSAAEIGSVVSRWQARGDLTPTGGLLIDCLEFLGVVPDAAAR